MMSQPFADVIQNVVECVRFQCHGAAEIDVFRAESHRNQRENEHRIVRDLPVQRFLDPSRCSLCNDLVRAKRTLVSMLLQCPYRDHDYRLIFIDLFHFQSCQFIIVPYHCFFSIQYLQTNVFLQSAQ